MPVRTAAGPPVLTMPTATGVPVLLPQLSQVEIIVGYRWK